MHAVLGVNTYSMITPELVSRINELARKKRTTGLSQEETAEQTRLRRLYLDDIRGQLKSTLDRVHVIDNPVSQGKKLH